MMIASRLAGRAGRRVGGLPSRLRRLYCTEDERTLVVNHEGGGIATVSLSSRPVNSLTKAMCDELVEVTRELEDDPNVRGMRLTSAVPNIFSAGLDLKSMHGKTDDELAVFWTSVQEMWLALYMTPLATVASISGHAPAGGCILALSCDYRVMVEGNFRIGLNESQIGIVAPKWLSRMLVDTVGMRPAERMLQLGSLLSPDDAKGVGLIDEVVPLHKLPGASADALEGLLAINPNARSAVKRQLRSAAADALRANQSEDLDDFIQVVQQPEVQVMLGEYIESLGKKKK
tara:strand:- start:1566 stop:2429 length:864 start_codon:yes stop_codon:yes gene_type:complete